MSTYSMSYAMRSPEQRERIAARRATRQEAGRKSAEMRTCAACKRRNVLGKPQPWDNTTARKCRRCGYWQVAA